VYAALSYLCILITAADGMQDAGTLRWKKKIVVAKGFPEQV